MIYKIFFCVYFLSFLIDSAISQTTITKWKDDKTGAISLTYDDGNRNQFKYAVSLMDRLQLPATFYIITGPIKGSRYQGKFIGRPVEDIIKVSASADPYSDNYFKSVS